MFDKGDYIVYGVNGVCRVEDITTMDIRGVDSKKKYYKLSPVSNPSSKIFMPVDNDKVIVRRMVGKDEAQSLLDAVPGLSPIAIENDKQREELYKRIMMEGDPVECFRIIITLYNRKMERVAQGKKNTSVDEKYFKQIENNLYGELALALECEKEDILRIIKETAEA